MNNSKLLDGIDNAIWALVKSIMDDHFLNENVLKEKISTFMLSGIYTVINESKTQLETKALNLKSEIARGAYNHNSRLRQEKMMELGEMNDKIKIYNRSEHAIKDVSEYRFLKEWVKQKFGDKAFVEYVQLQGEQKVALLRNHIKGTAKQLIPRHERLDEIVYSTKKQPQ